MLEKSLDLSRRMAEFFPGYESIADPLIDFANEGMKTSLIQRLFSELRIGLAPIIKSIIAQEEIDDNCLRQSFSEKGAVEIC